MAELATLARPYAKAVFDLGKAGNSLDRWSRMLAFLAVATEQDKVRQLMDSPDLASEEKARRLIELGGEELDEHGRNLVSVLAENKRLTVLPEIRDQFEARKAEEERVLEVEVVSAYELDAGQADKLRQALQRRFEREVNLTGRVDESVIGGVVIRAGDTVIDASLRGRLNKLAETLQKN